MKVCLLGSGSRGNAILVESGESRVLIDAGFSAREICRRLALIGVAPESISAVLITHEHSDHIRGLGPLSRRFRMPVYIHTNVVGVMADVGVPQQVCEFDEGHVIVVGDLSVQPFPLTHDAQSPVGFVVDSPTGKLGIATDLGIATRLVAERLRDCHCLVLESNHDEELLRDGPYPWKLKQRVRSKHGHLSNRDSGVLLKGLMWPGLESVFLAHLSETNNCPDLARSIAADIITGQNACAPELLVGRQAVPVSWSRR